MKRVKLPLSFKKERKTVDAICFCLPISGLASHNVILRPLGTTDLKKKNASVYEKFLPKIETLFLEAISYILKKSK